MTSVSQYSGFATRSIEQGYNILIEQLLRHLSRRLVKFYTCEDQSESVFIDQLKKLLSEMTFFERSKLLPPKYTDCIRELTGILKIKTPSNASIHNTKKSKDQAANTSNENLDNPDTSSSSQFNSNYGEPQLSSIVFAQGSITTTSATLANPQTQANPVNYKRDMLPISPAAPPSGLLGQQQHQHIVSRINAQKLAPLIPLPPDSRSKIINLEEGKFLKSQQQQQQAMSQLHKTPINRSKSNTQHSGSAIQEENDDEDEDQEEEIEQNNTKETTSDQVSCLPHMQDVQQETDFINSQLENNHNNNNNSMSTNTNQNEDHIKTSEQQIIRSAMKLRKLSNSNDNGMNNTEPHDPCAQQDQNNVGSQQLQSSIKKVKRSSTTKKQRQRAELLNTAYSTNFQVSNEENHLVTLNSINPSTSSRRSKSNVHSSEKQLLSLPIQSSNNSITKVVANAHSPNQQNGLNSTPNTQFSHNECSGFAQNNNHNCTNNTSQTSDPTPFSTERTSSTAVDQHNTNILPDYFPVGRFGEASSYSTEEKSHGDYQTIYSARMLGFDGLSRKHSLQGVIAITIIDSKNEQQSPPLILPSLKQATHSQLPLYHQTQKANESEDLMRIHRRASEFTRTQQAPQTHPHYRTSSNHTSSTSSSSNIVMNIGFNSKTTSNSPSARGGAVAVPSLIIGHQGSNQQLVNSVNFELQKKCQNLNLSKERNLQKILNNRSINTATDSSTSSLTSSNNSTFANSALQPRSMNVTIGSATNVQGKTKANLESPKLFDLYSNTPTPSGIISCSSSSSANMKGIIRNLSSSNRVETQSNSSSKQLKQTQVQSNLHAVQVSGFRRRSEKSYLPITEGEIRPIPVDNVQDRDENQQIDD